MIRAVIFDFNGVLVDDEALHFALFREVLAEEGVALDEERYHDRYLGFDDRGCFEAALADAGQDAGRSRVDDLIARKAIRYGERARQGLRIFPGAADAVRSLAGPWPLAICSGALRSEIEFALTLMDVRDLVAAIISAEETTRCKPDPEGYRLALDALRSLPGMSDLEVGQCLVIEDSLAGLASARAAGMRTVGVAHTYSARELRDAGAEVVIDDLGPLRPGWVGRQFTG